MRTAPLLAVAAATALLAGCTPASSSGASGGIYAEPVAPTAVAAEHGPTAQADEASPVGDAATTDPAATRDLASCVVGDWDIPNSSLMAGVKYGFQQSSQPTDPTPQVEIEGSQWARLDGATLTTTYEHIVLHITIATEGGTLEEFATITGSTTQDYSAGDGTLWSGQNDVSGLAVTMSFTLDGQPFDFPGSDETAGQMVDALRRSGGTSHVTCTATTLHQVPVAGGQEVLEFATDLIRR